ncbi:MAG TPA: hypothetical protein VGG98_07175 [Solirubrobacteraceae bacterium]|jgi:hypothetical protein
MRIAFPKRRLALPAALLMTTLLSGAPSAGADVGETIIQRCTHGQSLSGFSQAAYRKALQELPTEVAEYSHCDALIRRAQLAAAGAGGGGGGSTGAGTGALPAGTPLTPTQRSALRRSPRGGAAPLRVGNQVIHPGVVHVDIASALSALPTPLLAILAFLLACALALVGGTIRNRVRAHRPR